MHSVVVLGINSACASNDKYYSGASILVSPLEFSTLYVNMAPIQHIKFICEW